MTNITTVSENIKIKKIMKLSTIASSIDFFRLILIIPLFIIYTVFYCAYKQNTQLIGLIINSVLLATSTIYLITLLIRITILLNSVNPMILNKKVLILLWIIPTFGGIFIYLTYRKSINKQNRNQIHETIQENPNHSSSSVLAIFIKDTDISTEEIIKTIKDPFWDKQILNSLHHYFRNINLIYADEFIHQYIIGQYTEDNVLGKDYLILNFNQVKKQNQENQDINQVSFIARALTKKFKYTLLHEVNPDQIEKVLTIWEKIWTYYSRNHKDEPILYKESDLLRGIIRFIHKNQLVVSYWI